MPHALRSTTAFETESCGFLQAETPRLIEAVKNRTFTVGILGLGYVGLPLAEAYVSVGMPVIGFEINQSKLDALAANTSYIRHIDDGRIAAMTGSGKFEASADAEVLRRADALLMCVPTPINAHREPDLTYVVKTTEMIGRILRPGQIVILESTTYPGTTEEVIKPILEQISGLKAGVDFGLAYSPEREDPGNLDFSTTTIPKVVGADSETELAIAVAMYSALTEVVPVSNLRTAEAVKLTENIFRLINISLVNELKFVFGGMDIDVFEVIDAARTKPFGFMAFYPGPGIGGHCIPIDPFYLTWKARAFGLSTRMIDLAGDISSALPRSVVEKTSEALDHSMRKSLSSAKVLVVGVAYKKNIDDLRESPALPILEILHRRGADVAYYDPHVATAEDAHGVLDAVREMKSVSYDAATLKQFDCAIIVTDHTIVDYTPLLENVPLVIDTRNATADLRDRYGHKIVSA